MREGKQAISALTSAVAQAPAVGHPNYKLPRLIIVREDRGLTLGVSTQKHGDQHGFIGYSSPAVRFVTDRWFSRLPLNRQ